MENLKLQPKAEVTHPHIRILDTRYGFIVAYI